MITFGAGFGYTVMGRIALLAIRLEFLFDDWLWLIDPYGKRLGSDDDQVDPGPSRILLVRASILASDSSRSVPPPTGPRRIPSIRISATTSTRTAGGIRFARLPTGRSAVRTFWLTCRP